MNIPREVFMYMSSLVAIAYADGDISPNELAFLQRKAKELLVDDDQLAGIIESAENYHIIKPKNIIERLQYLSDCIEMTTCDGEIHPKEFELCKKISKALNLSEEELHNEISIRNINLIKK